MKRLRIFLIGIICLGSLHVFAQKMVPYTFRFEHQADTLQERQLKVLTQVTYANTASLRLYFKGTHLGENSYLLLEGMDGAQQELRRQDLENWHFSSAYFNGNAVKVSLVEAAGEKNIIHISEIKVSDQQKESDHTARISSENLQSTTQTAATTSASLTETYSYAKAVGRFTDGTHSYGTGWIAPNGAIVTSWNIYIYYILGVVGKALDIIEFNVPPSEGTTVKHPVPEDQYPLKIVSPSASDARLIGFKNYNGTNSFSVGWGIIEPLPNSTGLRPGERQQQYFRIATNPSNYTINAQGNIPVDLFHYGQLPGDSYQGQFRTLRVLNTSLKKQNDYLPISTEGSRDNYVLYNAPSLLGFNENRFIGPDGGAPITYQDFNIAIGIHEYSLRDLPSVGLGFKDDGLRNNLKNFFSAQSVYVDSEGLYDPATGEIHKPYLTVWSAAQYAPNGAQVYIAKGNYYAPLTINRPMTLHAPVGKVVLGAANPNARTSAAPSIPRELLMEEPLGFNDLEEELETSARIVSYPNPFTDRTELKYALPEETAVTIKVYDIVGNEVRTLLHSSQREGNHTIVWDGQDSWGKPAATGMYIIKLQTGTQIHSVRVIKK
jgi:hypothetical protein